MNYNVNKLAGIDNKLTVTKEEKGVHQEFWINICTLLCIKQMTDKALLYSTGNYTQYFIITHKKKESDVYLHTHITETLCCIPETNTIL